jgi:hypothetical protein
MSIAENILDINKKIVTINFTNLESLKIIKDEKVSDYMIKLSDCYEKSPDDDQKYFQCILKSVCPEQTESFLHCQKENKNNISVCTPILLHLEKCMKSYSNRTLELVKRAKEY